MFTLFGLLASLALGAVWLLKFWLKNREFYDLARRIPVEAKGHLPIVGGVFQMFSLKSFTEKAIVLQSGFSGLMAGNSSPRKFWLAHQLVVVVDDPDQLRTLLTSKHAIQKPNEFWEGALFEHGMFRINDSDQYKQHRKIVEPVFSTTNLRNFVPVLNQNCRNFFESKTDQWNGKELEMFIEIGPLVFDNILTTVGGIQQGEQAEKVKTYMDGAIGAAYVFGARLLDPLIYHTPLFKMSQYNKMEQQFVNGKTGMNQLVKEIFAKIRKTQKDGNDNNDCSSKQRLADVLFEKAGVLSDSEIYAELNSVVFAGFEAPNTAIAETILLLAFHQHIQQKLFEELREVFENQDEDVTYDHIAKLTYLDMTLKEATRLWPVVTTVSRYLTENLELGSYTVPAGANVVVPMVHLHRNKKIWGEDAEEFKPERFSPENQSKLHSYAFLPFLRGQRNCVGVKYAMLAMKIVLVHFFRNFKVSTDASIEDVKFEYCVVTKVVGGYNMKVEKRNWKKDV